MNTALLHIEIQNDYFSNGRMPLERSIETSQRAKEALQAYRNNQLPIIHIQHISTHPEAVHFLPCTKGVEFHENTLPLKGETIIKKHYPNSFKDTTLLNHLKKMRTNHLVIAGMTTHMAIDATVRAAYDLGFSFTVLHDACTAKTLECNDTIISAAHVHYAFLAALRSIYASIISTKELAQLLGVQQKNVGVLSP